MIGLTVFYVSDAIHVSDVSPPSMPMSVLVHATWFWCQMSPVTDISTEYEYILHISWNLSPSTVVPQGWI